MKTLLPCFTLVVFALSALATPPPPVVVVTATKLLIWSPSPSPGVKYRLYHSTNDLTWHTNYLTTGTNYTVTVQAGSTNWFMVKAVNVDGIESDPSNVYEQPIQPKPAPAGPLQAVPVTTEVQYREPNGEWNTFKVYTNNLVVTPGAREFRARLGIGQPVELVTVR